MKKICPALMLLVAAHAMDAAAGWDFRGQPNSWGQSPLTELGNGQWEIVQSFTAGENEFKIARDDGWLVSFPAENFRVEAGATYRILFDEISGLIRTEVQELSSWNFRGTPNAWGETPLMALGSGRFALCQQFSNGDEFGGPRFKIARNGWNISFPAEDVLVTEGSAQDIVFNEVTQQVTFETVVSCAEESNSTWNFRGTPNAWGETVMTDLGQGIFETCQSFSGGDESGGPRFKIVSAQLSWALAFPQEDFAVESHRDVKITFDENLQTIDVSAVASCSNPDAFAIVGQRPRVTLKDTPFVLNERSLLVSNGEVVSMELTPGDNYDLDGERVIPHADFVGGLFVGINAANADAETASFNFRLEVIDFDTHRNLIVHTPDILSAANVNLSLTRFFDHLAASANEPGLTAVDVFRQFWDIQNTPSDISVGPNCGDETLKDGMTPALNGFPLVCNRQEGLKVRDNDSMVQLEMASYFPIAAINRFDLHRPDFSDCGEHRMIFARGRDRGPGRNFLITEARVANPEPGDPVGCQPLVNFWLKLATLSTNDAAAEIERAYYQGIENFPPLMSIQHFLENAGQIRTNQFISFEWMLREQKLTHSCDETCVLRAIPVSAKENPFGRLFNGTEAFSGSEFAERAADFQRDFILKIGSLINNDLAALSIKTEDRFNNGQSHASGRTAENNFVFHFMQSEGSDFFNQLNAAVVGALDARGQQLSAAQVLNRASALTCGGCHQPSAFGLTFPRAIGAMRLPNGEIIDSWPSSAGFVHVSEFTDFEGHFRLSPALEQVFLPIREDLLHRYLAELAQ